MSDDRVLALSPCLRSCRTWVWDFMCSLPFAFYLIFKKISLYHDSGSLWWSVAVVCLVQFILCFESGGHLLLVREAELVFGCSPSCCDVIWWCNEGEGDLMLYEWEGRRSDAVCDFYAYSERLMYYFVLFWVWYTKLMIIILRRFHILSFFFVYLCMCGHKCKILASYICPSSSYRSFPWSFVKILPQKYYVIYKVATFIVLQTFTILSISFLLIKTNKDKV